MVITALSALAQETRLAVFRLLVQAGPAGIAAGGVSTRLDIPAATLSFHLRELSHAGLVTATRQSRSIIYAADFAAMRNLIGFLTENCCTLAPDASCGPGLPGCGAPEQEKESLS